MNTIDQRLAELGITLPDAPAPAANYVPYVISGNTVYVSGQISKDESGLMTGRLGDGVSIEDGQAAARVCGLALIAQLKAACGGDLSRLVQVIKLNGYVNSSPEFVDQPTIINAASDLMVDVFGDAGRHARAAVGCSALPLGVSVEIEAIFRIA